MKSYKEWAFDNGEELLLTEGIGEWINNWGNQHPKAFERLMALVTTVGIGAFATGFYKFVEWDKAKHPEKYEKKDGEDDGPPVGGDRPGRIRMPHDYDPRSPFNSIPGQ